MKRNSSTLKYLIMTLCLLSPLVSTAGLYNKIYVFGDSLSDTGNLAALAAASPAGSDPAVFNFLNFPPYQHGFTNGSTAVVELANLLNVPSLVPSLYLLNTIAGTNFAVAGARAAGNTAIDLNTQVGAFLSTQGGHAPPDALYILFIGGNDIRDMRNAADLKSANSILQRAKDNIRANLSMLLASGARHVMVANSPDIGKLPETKALSATNPAIVAKASLFTIAYNKGLADVVNKVQKATGIDLVLFDVFTVFDNIVKDSRSFNFINVKNACYSSVAFVFYPLCDDAQLDNFIFFDEIHPTRRVHERVGRAMFALVPEAD